MKQLVAAALTLLLAVQAAPVAFAHDHPQLPLSDTDPTVISSWAEEETARAADLGLYTASFQDNTRPINRREYCEAAMAYVRVQQQQAVFWNLVEQYKAEKNDQGELVNRFSDCEDLYPIRTEANLAYAIGLVQGRGEGIFDPETSITRQEAAVMLCRAYTAIGGTLPQAEAAFADGDQVADWARESVGAVQALGIMEGVGENRFAPLDSYSVEQCVVTFLRLYEKAPVSVARGNVEKLFDYDQVMEWYRLRSEDAAAMPSYQVSVLAENDSYTLLRIDQGAVMTYYSTLCLVGRDGSVRNLDPGVCSHHSLLNVLATRTEIRDIRFSEDGRELTFTIPLTEDFVWQMAEAPVLLHEKGDYVCTFTTADGQRVSTARN